MLLAKAARLHSALATATLRAARNFSNSLPDPRFQAYPKDSPEYQKTFAIIKQRYLLNQVDYERPDLQLDRTKWDDPSHRGTFREWYASDNKDQPLFRELDTNVSGRALYHDRVVMFGGVAHYREPDYREMPKALATLFGVRSHKQLMNALQTDNNPIFYVRAHDRKESYQHALRFTNDPTYYSPWALAQATAMLPLFLDKNGILLPPNEWGSLSVLAYSLGCREYEQVVRAMADLLLGILQDKHGADAEQAHAIAQKIMSYLRAIMLGYAVNWPIIKGPLLSGISFAFFSPYDTGAAHPLALEESVISMYPPEVPFRFYNKPFSNPMAAEYLVMLGDVHRQIRDKYYDNHGVIHYAESIYANMPQYLSLFQQYLRADTPSKNPQVSTDTQLASKADIGR